MAGAVGRALIATDEAGAGRGALSESPASRLPSRIRDSPNSCLCPYEKSTIENATSDTRSPVAKPRLNPLNFKRLPDLHQAKTGVSDGATRRESVPGKALSKTEPKV